MIACCCVGCGGNEEPPVDKPTPVRIQRASNGPAVPPIDTSGVVATKHEMRLSFKMGGVVRRIHVQEGDVVKKGQRLAEIELTEVDAQVEQARQLAEKAARDLQARRKPLRRPGDQSRAAAGPAHAGRRSRPRSTSPRSSTRVIR